MIRRLLIGIAMALFAGQALAEDLIEELALEGRWQRLAAPVFDHLGADQGLPSDFATSLAEDGDGFLWVGTYSGLARFDGYRFTIFRPTAEDADGLPDSQIIALHTDRTGRIWVGTSDGLAYYDRNGGRFSRVPIGAPKSAVNRIWTVADDGADGIWIGTNKGLVHYGFAGRTVAIEHPPDERVYTVLPDPDGGLWIGTESGLFHRAGTSKPFEAVHLPTTGGKPPSVIALFRDSEARIWAGSVRDGAWVIQSDGRPLAIAEDQIAAIGEIRPGEIWLGSFRRGIIVVDGATLSWQHVRHDPTLARSLDNDKVRAIMTDRSGLVWVATDGGINRHNPDAGWVEGMFGSTRDPLGISESDVRSVMVDTGGNVWLGLETEGIEVFDPVKGRIAALRPDSADPKGHLPADRIYALCQMSDGTVAAGTNRGLYRIDAEAKRAARMSLGRYDADLRIQTLHCGAKELWVGSRNHGLLRLDPETHEAVSAGELTDLRIEAIEPDGHGALWVGTSNGLNRLDPATGKIDRYWHDAGKPESLSGAYVLSLHADRRDRLWIGTLQGGVDVLDLKDPTHFRMIGQESGLPDPTAATILEDSKGRIWVGTNRALGLIDPETFKAAAVGRADGVPFRVFWARAGVSLGDELLFGAAGGLAVIHPDLIKPWTYRPPVVVTDVEIGGRTSQPSGLNDPSGGRLTVEPGSQGFSVEFAALDYSAPERNRYAYRLDGVDRDWVETDSSRRVVHYTSLPPGDYTLHLRGSNRDGVWTETEPKVAIHVMPAWYQTTWVLIAEMLAALLAVAALVHLRTAYLRRRQVELERVIDERTAELNVQRVRAEEATSAKSSFLAMMSHEIRTPMNGVMSMSEMLEHTPLNIEQRDIARIIRQSASALLTIINDILDFSKIEAGRLDVEDVDFDLPEVVEGAAQLVAMRAREKDLDLSVSADPAVPTWIKGDPARLRQILLNLLGNAVKFTDTGSVRLNVENIGGKLRFEVRDTGIGLSAEQCAKLFQPFVQADSSTSRKFGGSGLGLSISRRLVELMGGTIGVASKLGEGSVFWFELPLRPGDPTAARSTAHKGAAVVFDYDAPSRQRAAAERAMVLVAEDNDTNRAVISRLLGRLGFTFDIGENGARALEMFDPERHGLVLTDFHMPEMDGFELTAVLRAGAGRDVPIVALTADALAGTAEKCRAAGMNDYLSKPIVAAKLALVLETYLPQGCALRRPRPKDAPPAIESIDAEILDLGRLRETYGEVTPAAIDFLARFIGDLPPRIETLGRSLGTGGDKDLAHSLKGAALTMGATRIGRLFADIEEMIGAEDMETAQIVFDMIEESYSELDAMAGKLKSRMAAE